MTEAFDPYYKWLGIKPGEQKNCYRLLGLNLFESDSDVIENLADQKIAAIRNYQLKYPKEATIILNQLTKAKVILLDPVKKKEYDQRLQKSLNNNHSIHVSEPPVTSRPPKPGAFERTQQTTSPIGEIPVTTRPPKPETFQKPQQVNRITGFSFTPQDQISKEGPPPLFVPKDKSSFNELELQDIVNDINNLQIEVKIETYNQKCYIGSCIGYLETIENNKPSLDDLDKKYKKICLKIHEQLTKCENKQKDDVKKLETKFWNDVWVYFVIPLIVLFPFLCFTLPIALILYSIWREKSIGDKIKKIEKIANQKTGALNQQQKKLDVKYHELLKALLNFTFTEQQNVFLNQVKNLFFKNKIVGMKPASGYDVNVYNQYSKTNNEYCSEVDNVSFNNLDPGFLGYTIPTIIIENLKLYFFPQGLLIEEHGKFSELNYNKINITPSENGLVVDKYPPENAEIAGTFWEHTRVNGEQDMRYKDNPQYYIIKYSGVLIQSASFSAKPFYFTHKESADNFIRELTAILQTAPIGPCFS